MPAPPRPIVCPRCHRRGFPYRDQPFCVACRARDGGPRISIVDDEDLEPARPLRAELVREAHLTAKRLELDEMELLEVIG